MKYHKLATCPKKPKTCLISFQWFDELCQWLVMCFWPTTPCNWPVTSLNCGLPTIICEFATNWRPFFCDVYPARVCRFSPICHLSREFKINPAGNHTLLFTLETLLFSFALTRDIICSGNIFRMSLFVMAIQTMNRKFIASVYMRH